MKRSRPRRLPLHPLLLSPSERRGAGTGDPQAPPPAFARVGWKGMGGQGASRHQTRGVCFAKRTLHTTSLKAVHATERLAPLHGDCFPFLTILGPNGSEAKWSLDISTFGSVVLSTVCISRMAKPVLLSCRERGALRGSERKEGMKRGEKGQTKGSLLILLCVPSELGHLPGCPAQCSQLMELPRSSDTDRVPCLPLWSGDHAPGHLSFFPARGPSTRALMHVAGPHFPQPPGHQGHVHPIQAAPKLLGERPGPRRVSHALRGV